MWINRKKYEELERKLKKLEEELQKTNYKSERKPKYKIGEETENGICIDVSLKADYVFEGIKDNEMCYIYTPYYIYTFCKNDVKLQIKH